MVNIYIITIYRTVLSLNGITLWIFSLSNLIPH
jgi:hypothetical protein